MRLEAARATRLSSADAECAGFAAGQVRESSRQPAVGKGHLAQVLGHCVETSPAAIREVRHFAASKARCCVHRGPESPRLVKARFRVLVTKGES